MENLARTFSGGGLGKAGEGISEPITATSIVGREGLGAATVGKGFKQKVRRIIEEYAAGESLYDLVFTTGESAAGELKMQFGKTESLGSSYPD